MRHERSGFWAFIWSLVPGCAEMYFGLMKQGVSIMSMFFGVIALAAFLQLEPLMFLVFIIWFYGFFHARNLVRLSPEERAELEDSYIIVGEENPFGTLRIRDGAMARLAAAALIFIGAYLILDTLGSRLAWAMPDPLRRVLQIALDSVPRIVVGAGIIWAGVHMIRGKKKELDNE